jgi:para-nitrobenzyl esterase
MGTRAPWSPRQQAEVTAHAQQNLQGDLEHAPAHVVLKAGMAALHKEPSQLGYAPSAFLPVASAGLPHALLDPQWAAAACHAHEVYIRNTAHECAAFFFNDPAQRQASQEQVDQVLMRWPVSDLPASLLVDGCFAGASSGLSPYRQLVAAASWRQFERFPAEYGAQLSKIGKPVQNSRFEFESPLDGFLSGHCLDLPFQFGNLAAWTDAPMLAGIDTDHFVAVSQTMISEISAFARS